jgi:hypothetical protein
MSKTVIEVIKAYESNHYSGTDALASDIRVEQWIAAYHAWRNSFCSPNHLKDYKGPNGVMFPAELADSIHSVIPIENIDRINQLVAKGFTRDGILVASIHCEFIGYAVSRAEQIAEGDWK